MRFPVKALVLALSLCLSLLAGRPAAAAERIADVRVEGNRLVESSVILQAIQLKPGDTLSADAVDRDLRAIFALGKFRGAEARLETIEGRPTLIYRVDEYPLVRAIRPEGNKKFKLETITETMALQLPAIYQPQVFKTAIAALVQKYKEKGYYAVKIDHSIDDTLPGAAELVLKIDEGSKTLIKTIRFEGNASVPDDELRDALYTKEKHLFSFFTGRGTYIKEMAEADMQVVEDVYQNHGFVRVRVKQPRVHLLPDGDNLEMVFDIEEGDRYSFGTVEIRGEFRIDRTEVQQKLAFAPGETYNRSKLRASLLAINDLFADRGYAFVNVTPLTHIDPEQKTVNIIVDIEQGQQIYINRITIAGNATTMDKVIRREMRLEEGDLYSASKLRESKKRLRNTDYFEEVGISTRPVENHPYVDMNVDVTEKTTGLITLGAGYSTADGAIVSASIAERNFLGRGVDVTASAGLGTERQTYRVAVTDPYFLDYNLRAGIEGYNTAIELDEYDKDVAGGKLKFGFDLTEDWRTWLIYTYEQKDYNDISDTASPTIQALDGEETLSGLEMSLTRDRTDYRIDPSEGDYTQFSLEGAGIGGTQKFAKATAEYRYYLPLRWDTVFSIKTMIGYARGLGDEDVPVDERFYLGGISSMRGFDRRELGPKDGNDYVGGNKMFYTGFDYVFPLLPEQGFKGGVFVDVGNLWASDEQYFDELRYTAGAEVRWKSPLGPIRLGYGFNLAPKDDEPAGAAFFAVGTFF